MTDQVGTIDLERVLKLRVVVARYGEMDIARWWNTTGQLGRFGAVALRRGFPRTYRFAQARSVFAVARHRCQELFDPPSTMTLWSLPAAIEEEFESKWESWLDTAPDWDPFFQEIEALPAGDLLDPLRRLGLVSDRITSQIKRLRIAAPTRGIEVGSGGRPSNDTLSLLAGAFSLGDVGSPVVPYVTLAGDEG